MDSIFETRILAIEAQIAAISAMIAVTARSVSTIEPLESARHRAKPIPADPAKELEHAVPNSRLVKPHNKSGRAAKKLKQITPLSHDHRPRTTTVNGGPKDMTLHMNFQKLARREQKRMRNEQAALNVRLHQLPRKFYG